VVQSAALQSGLFGLRLETDARLVQACEPGRYLMVRVGDGNEPYLPRPYWVRRVSSVWLNLLVDVGGAGSRWLATRRPGDPVEFFGPLGTPLIPPPRTRRLLLSGDIAGLNCLLALADRALASDIEVTLVFQGAIDTTARMIPPDVELLAELDADTLTWADALYAVGDRAVVQSAKTALRTAGSRIPAFGVPHVPLACGVGACYGCLIGTRRGAKLSCVDGPAFGLADLS
jgi:dihydroorotate dehydrogenase electron transfer subunit